MRLTLSERMVLTRRRLGLTQAELGKLLRVDRSTVSRAERGKKVQRGTVETFLILEKRRKGK